MKVAQARREKGATVARGPRQHPADEIGLNGRREDAGSVCGVANGGGRETNAGVGKTEEARGEQEE